MLELANGGWAEALTQLRQYKDIHLVIAVRDKFTEEVAAKWEITSYTEFRVSESDPGEAASRILSDVCL
jgi:hypothetical protein